MIKMNKYQILMADTDGIALGLSSKSGKNNKKQIVAKVKQLEKKWRKTLNFPEFELDTEYFDFQLHVGHKNYIHGTIGSIETINTKGNNFRAKNKSKLGYKVLKQVIFDSIKNIGDWELKDKKLIRAKIKNNIIDNTNETIENIDMSTVDIEDLILHEYVKPISSYKKADSIYAIRTKAIEEITGMSITHSARFPMLVGKEHLPGIDKVSPKRTKCIHYMFPMDYIKEKDVDLDWYKNNVRDYIFGAFGIGKVKLKKSSKKVIDEEQNTLADFM